MVVRTGITCRHQIQQNKNTEHSIHELKCIAMCLPPSGRGNMEIWSSSWADGNRRRRSGAALGRMGTSGGGWEQGEPEQSIWLMAPLLGDADGWRGGVRATTFRRRRGWDGMARSRLPARGCGGDDVVWPMAAGRRPGDVGWAAGQNRGILVFSCDPSPLN